jgi:thiol-disulfide isomerase/thioredoxin
MAGVKASMGRTVLVAAVLAAITAGSAWWLIVGKSPPLASGEAAACAQKPEQLKNLRLAQGPISSTADLPVRDAAGKPGSFADWRGRPVLVNFWATWCAPCVKEMPALARLSASLNDQVLVAALSEDRPPTTAGGGEMAVPDLIRRFYQVNAITGLPVLVDPAGEAARVLKIEGLPSTVLLDASGREVGRLVGPAEWDGAGVAEFLIDCLKALGGAG